MNEQQKARIVTLAILCERGLACARSTTRPNRVYSEKIAKDASAEAFRIAQGSK